MMSLWYHDTLMSTSLFFNCVGATALVHVLEYVGKLLCFVHTYSFTWQRALPDWNALWCPQVSLLAHMCSCIAFTLVSDVVAFSMHHVLIIICMHVYIAHMCPRGTCSDQFKHPDIPVPDLKPICHISLLEIVCKYIILCMYIYMYMCIFALAVVAVCSPGVRLMNSGRT